MSGLNSQPPPSPADVFLRAAARLIAGQIGLDELLQKVLDEVISLTGATKGFVILADPEGGLDFRSARNMNREELENPTNLISRNAIRRVLDSGEALLVANATDDPAFAGARSVHNLALKSILCAPLRAGASTFGVVYLENRLAAGTFREQHLAVVRAVAEMAAHALGMTRTFEGVRGERDRLEEENKSLRETFRREYDFGRFVGHSAVMQKVERQIEAVAPTTYTVLIRGESGTGKELVARILHAASPRSSKPFVAINCAAVPATLFEAELFGHQKGAFTGAERARVGKVEAAEGGTLFLDEVGDLPLEVQPKLLRLLQERTYERLGDNQVHKADVRVVAATNKNLADAVAKRLYREDLFHRLNQLPIVLPSLRERPEDIPELAEYFLRKEGRRLAGFTKGALEFLKTHPWPGNVRSLRNVILRAAVYASDGDAIDVTDIRSQLDESDSATGDATGIRVEVPADAGYDAALETLERSWLKATLRRWPTLRRAQLAERLGMSKRTLFDRLRKLGVTEGEREAE